MIGRTSTLQNSKMMWEQISKTNNKYTELTKQLSTGKKVNSILDDAVAAKGILSANKELSKIQQYKDNMSSATSELNLVDDNLGTAVSQVQRAYDLAMAVSNGTYGASELEAYKTEIDSIIENVRSIANTKYNDTYLFSGTKTTTAPYTMDSTGMHYEGDNGERTIQIGDDEAATINYQGDDIFGYAELTTDVDGNVTVSGEGIFKALYEIKTQLEKDPIDTTVINNSLPVLNEGLNDIVDTRTKVGLLSNRFSTLTETYENDKTTITELKSKLEDVDMAEIISQWMASQQSMQASYSMLSKTSDLSLLNYI